MVAFAARRIPRLCGGVCARSQAGEQAPLGGADLEIARLDRGHPRLAEVQLKRTSDKVTVIYLIDQSISIPEDQRRLMIRYVNEEIRKHRNATREDKAGVIVFARDPAIEHPPYDEAIRVPENIESRIENDATNLEGAMKLAQAALPRRFRRPRRRDLRRQRKYR